MFERVVMRGGGREASGIEVKSAQQQVEFKPHGLWYGIDDSWLEWCESDSPAWIGDQFYKLDVDESRILILNPSQLDAFTKEWGCEPPWRKEVEKTRDAALLKATEMLEKMGHRNDYIDWPRLAEKYDGIEIKPYSWHHRMKFMWYYGWDCASGVLWNPKALRGFTKIDAPKRRKQESAI